MWLIAILVIIVIYIIVRNDNKNTQKNESIKETTDRAEQKGEQGEQLIIKLLGQTIPGQRYLINNLIIKDQYGNTSQIDHIFINSNGVFVIETKNLSGTIYGNDYRKEWTQVFNYGKQKYHFYNPIMQNSTHIRRLQEATGTNLPIKPIVVFANNNIDKIDSKNVYTIEGMICEINAYFEERILPEEMETFYKQLCRIKETQPSDEEHVKNVQDMKKAI